MISFRCSQCAHTEQVDDGELGPDEVLACAKRFCTGKMRRINRAPHVEFKGSGFYSND